MGLFVVLGGLQVVVQSPKAEAAAGVNQQINFQARLLNAQGATVPDGTYNVQFKIYQDGDGCVVSGTSPCNGTLQWTESWLNNTTQGVTVKNGYFSVYLGAITSLSTVDFNQDNLWLSLNIGNTNATCSPFTNCGGDGEMLPFKRFASNPYALNSGKLGGRTSSQFVQIAPGAVQADTSAASTIFINKDNAAGNILQLQKAASDVFVISNSGTTAINTNSATALTVQNGSNSAFGVDTTNIKVAVGLATSSASSRLSIAGQGATNGITLGDGAAGSINLYVSANDTLKTDDSLVVVGSISTLGSSSVTSGGAFIGPTSGNTINGLVVNASALSSITSISLSGAISGGTTYSGSGDITSTGGSVVAGTHTGTGAVTVSSGGSSGLTLDSASGTVTIATGDAISSSGRITTSRNGTGTGDSTVAITGTAVADTTSSLVRIGSAINGGSSNGTYLGINAATGFTGNLQDLQTNGTSVLKVDNIGNITSGITSLDGSSTTSNTAALASTSMNLTSAASFDIGNYIRLDNNGSPCNLVTVCYAKITNKASNTLTISPALTWSSGRSVTEVDIAEIGSSTLTTRYGQGYFINGITTGNGSTEYTDGAISSNAGVFELLNASVTTLNIGGAAATINIGTTGGTTTLTGNLSVTGTISGGAPTTGTSGYLSRSGTTLQPANSGDSFTTSGSISTSGAGTITSAGAFSGPTTGNTINGLIVNTGALSGVTSISLNSSISGGTTYSGSGNITSTGGSVVAGTHTGTAAVTVSSGGTSGLTLDSASGIVVTAAGDSLNAAAGLNTGAGNGTQRIDANGALSNITTISLNGAISGGTTYSGSGDITSTGGSVSAATHTGSGAVTVSSGGSGALTMTSASGTAILGGSTNTLQRTNASFALDVVNVGAASTLNVINSNATQVANLDVEGGLNIGSGQTYKIGSADINTAGTLTNVAYENQNNVFTGTNTFQPTTNISSVAIKQNSSGSFGQDIFSVQGSSSGNFIQVTSTAANQGAVTIQSLGANGLTLQSGNGTVTLGSSTGLTATGALTVSSGGSSGLTLDSASGTIATAAGDSLNAAAGLNTGAGNGTQRIDANGALSNITSIGLSGAISGGTTYSGSGDITSTGGSVVAATHTGSGAVALSSGGSSALTLTSASGTAILGGTTNTIQRTNASFAIDVVNVGAASTFNVTNSNASQVAHLDVEGGLNIGSGQTYKIGSADINTAGTLTNVAYENQNNTFTGTNTFQPTTNISSVVIKQNSSGAFGQDVFSVQGSSSGNFIQVTSTAANQGAVTIQSLGAQALTLQSGNGTVTLGSSTGLTATGALTVSSGGSSGLTLDSASGTVVTAAGDSLNAAAGLNTGAGAGTQRIDANGALSSITSISLSGAISGGTTYSGSGNITSTGGSVVAATHTGSGAVTVSSGGSSALTLTSASGTAILGGTTNTIQRTNSALSLDVVNAGAASTLNVINSDATQVANLNVDGGLNIGSGQTYKINNADINTAGTLTNVAYENQANVFTAAQSLQHTNGSAFLIQTNSGAATLLTADTTAMIIKIGTTSAGDLSGVDLVAAEVQATGSLKIGSGADYIEFNATGPVYAGARRPSKSIVLQPEYPGAVLGPDDSATTTGTMTSDNAGSGTSWKNYYDWTSLLAGSPEYSVLVRVTLPSDFDSWETGACPSSTCALEIDYQTGLAATTNNAVSIRVHNVDETPGTAVCTIAEAASATWASFGCDADAATSLDDGTGTEWDAAGETAVIRIKLKSNNTASARARVGEITLRYKARY